MLLFSPFSLMLLFITSITTLLLFLFFNKIQCNKNKLPPGPKRLPLIGNLHQLSSSPHKSIPKLAKQHGPIMLLQLGAVPTLVISSADAARDVLKTNDLVSSNRPQLYAAGKLSYNFKDITFAPYGDHWRKVRKIAILELLSLKRILSFEEIRVEETELFLDSIASSSGPVDLSRAVLLLSSNIITRATFGKKYGSTSRLEKMLHEVEKLLTEFCFSDYFPGLGWLDKFTGLDAKLDENFVKMETFYDEVIEEHLDPNRPKSNQEDLVDVLLRIQKDPDNGISLTNQDIKGVMTDMFIAGSDTSAATIIWTMAELIRHPLLLNIAQKEVRETVSGKNKVDESDLPKLVYLKSVIKESLRLRPPVPFLVPRETSEDSTVGEYIIPAKTRVLINTISMGTDPDYWEDPQEFKPERFLGSSCVDFRGQNFEFIPFGAGRRGCPGMNFGLSVVELVLANLLYRFEWELPDGMRVEDLDMEAMYGLAMFKKTPLCLVPVEHRI